MEVVTTKRMDKEKIVKMCVEVLTKNPEIKENRERCEHMVRGCLDGINCEQLEETFTSRKIKGDPEMYLAGFVAGCISQLTEIISEMSSKRKR